MESWFLNSYENICKGLRIFQTILERRTKLENLLLPDFKIYYEVPIIKRVWYWVDIYRDQWNRMSLEKEPQI